MLREMLPKPIPPREPSSTASCYAIWFHRYHSIVCAIVCSGLLAVAISPVRAEASLTGLGFLPDLFSTSARDVSADGSVVVGVFTSYDLYGGSYRAFRWTRSGGLVGLAGNMNVGNTVAWGVSADGSVVVGSDAYRWTSDGGFLNLGFLDGGGGIATDFALSLSADGSIAVGYSFSAFGKEAFRWTSAGGMVGLGDLPGGNFASDAGGISADGSVIVGGGNSASGTEAFRWTSVGGMVGIGDLPGGDFSSGATDVSADGTVIVGTGNSASGTEAFRWTSAGGMVGLGAFPGGNGTSRALDVSADGSVVVGRSNSASGDEAFIWDAGHGMRNLRDVLVADYGLNLTGWSLNQAWGISADGLTIVGDGVNPSGFAEAWIAVLESGQEGDYNHDGTVDAADYVVLRKNGGTPEDYEVWRAHFGEPGGNGSGASVNTNVPEPATSLLMMIAAVGWYLRRGRVA